MILDDIYDLLPVVYTPTVGEACQQFSRIYQHHRGLFISYPDIDRIEEMLRSVPHAEVAVIVVTDGERAMVAAMAPKLRADGLIFVGLDVIGGRLTEVNVTSPTGIQELSRHEGKDRAADVILWLEKKAEELAPNLASFGG